MSLQKVKSKIQIFRSPSGRISGFNFKSISEPGDFIFIAAMPKSGGTFLSKKMAEYLGYEYIHLSDRRGGCEFDIYPPAIEKYLHKDVVVHQHTLGTEGNVHYIKKHNMKLVWLVRNLPDALVSFRDHLLHEHMRWPFFSVPDQFRQLSKKKQYDVILDFVAPWYLHFYVSWYRQIFVRQDVEASILQYEKFSDRTLLGLFQQLRGSKNQQNNKHFELGLRAPDEKDRYRVNKGIAGRAKDELQASHQKKLEVMAAHYGREIDFQMLGL